ncbi:MAG: hypothetical protein ABIQ90_05145 [Polaromonas sp.]
MNISPTKIAGGLIISVIALMSLSASAGPVNVDINVVVPGVYEAPQPVYVLPGPVYQAAPVYIQQRPAYVEQEDGYWECKKNKCKQKRYKKEKHHEHDRDDD